MNIWHFTPDAPREPGRSCAGEPVTLTFGTWPIGAGQSVHVECHVTDCDGVSRQVAAEAIWRNNEGANSYWQATIGPFERGDRVTYSAYAIERGHWTPGAAGSFEVGPKLYLALLWHHHQPLYLEPEASSPTPSYRFPWVRLHALRDYYSMAALVSGYPGVHVTFNLTPSLLRQLEDYTDRGATDVALELTRKPAEALTPAEIGQLLSTFFEADWHHQLFPHDRYRELFVQRKEGRAFSSQDLRDLQMWFNLAWFGIEFRSGEVHLATGETCSVARFVTQARGFRHDDIEAMLEEQYKLMRAIVPIHRQLQDRGQIEVSTTPFYHPILPLIIDTDKATVDRPGASLPPRFSHPDDADLHVQLAVDEYVHCFGRPPRGMWPAEGAVAQFAIPFFARHGVKWVASDRGVLARSGPARSSVDDPCNLCQPYHAREEGLDLSVFFRDTSLSDGIGFRYQSYPDQEQAARAFLQEVKERFAERLSCWRDRVLTVILDGENAWGSYRDDARPFLHALYRLLEEDEEVCTVNLSEYLESNPARHIAQHAVHSQSRLPDLFTGSWIDEAGSAPGVDLGTWIGEPEENRGWELLGRARDFLSHAGVTREAGPAAWDALLAAEGSDWFWWFGGDQDSGRDPDFDDLFRAHLRHVYRALGSPPPPELDRHIVPQTVVWTHTAPVAQIQRGDRLTLRTHCPGRLTWRIDDRPPETRELEPSGGVMEGTGRHQLTLGPFEGPERVLELRFECSHCRCDGRGVCCDALPYRVRIQVPDAPASRSTRHETHHPGESRLREAGRFPRQPAGPARRRAGRSPLSRR